ncbi:MAG: hypothetical protein AN484_22065 [Aphanizomenon flos-aquae WA102]|uniref:Uncharacterized protein n=1 Tax=Aphanizomenon flos-aquae WA102 TaxID=1710896 RepID=A0A1B7WUN8_APHFL|nr:MAG: hypothetical protein AN484_22065 [Aphanizomenon flos-aquae WA102]
MLRSGRPSDAGVVVAGRHPVNLNAVGPEGAGDVLVYREGRRGRDAVDGDRADDEEAPSVTVGGHREGVATDDDRILVAGIVRVGVGVRSRSLRPSPQRDVRGLGRGVVKGRHDFRRRRVGYTRSRAVEFDGGPADVVVEQWHKVIERARLDLIGDGRGAARSPQGYVHNLERVARYHAVPTRERIRGI